MKPLLEFEPEDYITPLLHLLIGIVNKGWSSLCHFLDEFVENVSDVETSLKDDILELDTKIDLLKDKIDIHTVNRNVALAEKENEDEEAKEMYEISKTRLKDLTNSKKKTNDELRQKKNV